jgi:hypothetical protein
VGGNGAHDRTGVRVGSSFGLRSAELRSLL